MTTSHRVGADVRPAMQSLEISVRIGDDDTAVVVLAGELDVASAPELRTAIDRLLITGRNRIVVDLESVTFLDAAALDVMITATCAAAVSGGSLSVSHHAGLMQLLSFTCETHRVNVVATMQDPVVADPVPPVATDPPVRVGIPLVRPSGTDPTGASPQVSAGPHLPWLLGQAADGDERAFLAVYDATAPQAYGIALRLLGDPDEAAEVVAKAYLDLWLHSAAFRSSDVSASAWVLATVHRSAVDRARSPASDTAARGRDGGTPTSTPTGAPAPLAAGLALTERDAVELAYFDGRLHTEVEQLRGLPAGTARSRIRDGLLHLRDAAAAGRSGAGGRVRGT